MLCSTLLASVKSLTGSAHPFSANSCTSFCDRSHAFPRGRMLPGCVSTGKRACSLRSLNIISSGLAQHGRQRRPAGVSAHVTSSERFPRLTLSCLNNHGICGSIIIQARRLALCNRTSHNLGSDFFLAERRSSSVPVGAGCVGIALGPAL